jgi:decaprenylphospho-beta-D-erythro-pentofuranosid-2-ulose 2-reductase
MMNAFGDAQNILLVGGTSEIGLAIIAEHASSGSLQNVVLAGRNEIRLIQSKEAMQSRFAELSISVCLIDVLNTGHLANVIDNLFDFCEFDLVILAAGMLPSNNEALEDTALTVETAKVNFLGPLEIASKSLIRMLGQGHGVILNISSIAVVRARNDVAVYGASKVGLDYWIEAAGSSLENSGVRMVNLRPGMVRTRMSAGINEAPLTINSSQAAVYARRGLKGSKSTIWAPKGMFIIGLVLKLLPRSILNKLN